MGFFYKVGHGCPIIAELEFSPENSNRDLGNRKFHKSLGHGRPIIAELEFSKKILADIKNTGCPPVYQVGQGCPIIAELEFSVENSNRDLGNRKFHKSLGQGHPITAKLEFHKVKF